MTTGSGEKSLNQGFHAATLSGDGPAVSSMTAPGRPDLSDRVIRGAATARRAPSLRSLVVLDFTIVSMALPSIQRDLHVATTTLLWLVRAYAVDFGGFLLLGGRLADACGRARLYRIGLVVFVAASISGGLAVGPGLLIASRVVQGIGAALLTPAGLSC